MKVFLSLYERMQEDNEPALFVFLSDREATCQRAKGKYVSWQPQIFFACLFIE